MAKDKLTYQYPIPTEEDLARAQAVLSGIGGTQVSWGAINVFEVLSGEHRLALEQQASTRLMRATWALAAATTVLAIATVVLIFATLAA